MELRHRVRDADASSKAKVVNDGITYWICYKKKKTRVHSSAEEDSVLSALKKAQVYLSQICSLENSDKDLHLMNESSGAVISIHRSLRSQVADGDVLRICNSAEMEDMMRNYMPETLHSDDSKSPHSFGTLAMSRLKRIGNTSATFKAIQKTLEGTSNIHDNIKCVVSYPEKEPIFGSNDLEQEDPNDDADDSLCGSSMSKKACDICDVSWPDAPGHYMYRFKKNNILVHHGCTQFAAEVQKRYPETQHSREKFLAVTDASQVNQPGTFYIRVERAIELPGIQLFGSQAPYAKFSLLPWKEPVQTKPTEIGGRNPIWKRMHDNHLQLTHMYNSAITPIPLLEIEIWNSSYIADDLMACALLDMTPLLRYPNIEIRRWFTLSSRGAASAISGSFRSKSPRIYLSIKFAPQEIMVPSSLTHKFRVHQLKSIGIAIPICALCNRVIVNVLKSSWGYRCDNCSADVHKGCLVKAVALLPCKGRHAYISPGKQLKSETQQDVLATCKHKMMDFKKVDNNDDPTLESDEDICRIKNASRNCSIGDLYIELDSLHLCTKNCQPEIEFHAKNVYEGDTYCRISFGDKVFETSPVLKTADPSFSERVCFSVQRRDALLRLEAIDFGTEACVGEMSVGLFKILQRDADYLVYKQSRAAAGRVAQALKRHFGGRKLKLLQGETGSVAKLYKFDDDGTRYDLHLPSKASSSTGNSKKAGYAIVKINYVESKRDLFRFRHTEETQLLEREQKECNVDSLKATFDRLSRVIRLFRYVDLEYSNIISWKHKPKSTFVLTFFVLACIKVNLEYVGTYIFQLLIVALLYQLPFRMSNSYLERWIGYAEYETEQSEKLKPHRPIADLYIAIHEAYISEQTEKNLVQFLSSLDKDYVHGRAKLYVRIKYMPNDKVPTTSFLHKGAVYIPSDYDEALIGWTHAVDMNSNPKWRTKSFVSHANVAAGAFGSTFASKARTDHPYRNFNISWRHDPVVCSCLECTLFKKEERNLAAFSTVTCGIDNHAFYFPIPQTRKKNSTGHESLVPWKVSPGNVQCELCISSTGEAKEIPDFIVAIGSISLKSYESKIDSLGEIKICLKLQQPFMAHHASDTDCSEMDTLHIRLRLHTQKKQSILSGFSEGRPIHNHRYGLYPLKHSSCEETIVETHLHTSGDGYPSSKVLRRAERTFSDYVCSSLTRKEKYSSGVLGSQLFDTFHRMMETMKTIQNEIVRGCGTVACIENLFNWTHPWKTAVACVCFFFAAIIFSIIPNRWIVLIFGLFEFAAGLLKDRPPSNHFRNMIWNFLSSIPTDEDLVQVYADQREAYDKSKLKEKQLEQFEILRLRHHAHWVGFILSRADNERNYKSFALVYRAFRFLLWKTMDDANSNIPPIFQLLIESGSTSGLERIQVVQSTGFAIYGFTAMGSKEKRFFISDAGDEMQRLMEVIRNDLLI